MKTLLQSTGGCDATSILTDVNIGRAKWDINTTGALLFKVVGMLPSNLFLFEKIMFIIRVSRKYIKAKLSMKTPNIPHRRFRRKVAILS